MSFHIRPRKIDDRCVIFDMYGRLTEPEAIREVLRQALDGGLSQFIFNMADVTYIGSSGLGALTKSYLEISGQPGQVRITGLTRQGLSLLVITKLVTVFTVCDDEQQAFASLRLEEMCRPPS